MTEIEEIVARYEARPGYIMPRSEINAIIASWRERGEALKDCADELESLIDHEYKMSDGRVLPEYQSRYDRDIIPVIRARTALNGKAKSHARD